MKYKVVYEMGSAPGMRFQARAYDGAGKFVCLACEASWVKAKERLIKELRLTVPPPETEEIEI
jgi:putative intracellular protease/amidase